MIRIELEKETGWIVSVAIVVVSLAAVSARTLPGMAEWPGIHWMKMEDDMELMGLWIKKLRGFDEIIAWHKLPLHAGVGILQWQMLLHPSFLSLY